MFRHVLVLSVALLLSAPRAARSDAGPAPCNCNDDCNPWGMMYCVATGGDRYCDTVGPGIPCDHIDSSENQEMGVRPEDPGEAGPVPTDDLPLDAGPVPTDDLPLDAGPVPTDDLPLSYSDHGSDTSGLSDRGGCKISAGASGAGAWAWPGLVLLLGVTLSRRRRKE